MGLPRLDPGTYIPSAKECVKMLDAAARLWAKINEFMKRIVDLEEGNEETQKDVKRIKQDIETLTRRLQCDEKVQAHQGKEIVAHEQEIAALELRVGELEKKNRGLAISAGMAKAKVRAQGRAKH
jgi:predicted  nucleic acid-binding Zn-ribbon protein